MSCFDVEGTMDEIHLINNTCVNNNKAKLILKILNSV